MTRLTAPAQATLIVIFFFVEIQPLPTESTDRDWVKWVTIIGTARTTDLHRCLSSALRSRFLRHWPICISWTASRKACRTIRIRITESSEASDYPLLYPKKTTTRKRAGFTRVENT